MTNEEAMRKIESQKLLYLEEYVDYSGISEAYDMAIQALKKQTPKKPVFEKDRYGTNHFYCPSCKKVIIGAMYNGQPRYCSCGQALDWSEENANNS